MLRVGDVVQYVGSDTPQLRGAVGLVVGPITQGNVRVRWFYGISGIIPAGLTSNGEPGYGNLMPGNLEVIGHLEATFGEIVQV